MSDPVRFLSVRGRVYSPTSVVPVVLRLLRRRWPAEMRVAGWKEQVLSKLQDPKWLRFRNGQTPGSLATDLDLEVLRRS